MKRIDLEGLNKESISSLAKKLASLVQKKDIILLKGDLGSGKTFFAKSFINNFYLHDENVTSPTFNIIQTYETNLFTIWHFDLYRLKLIEEAFDIGIEQAFEDGVSLIEWPELIEELLPDDFLELNFNFIEDESKRLVHLNLYGKWKTINFY